MTRLDRDTQRVLRMVNRQTVAVRQQHVCNADQTTTSLFDRIERFIRTRRKLAKARQHHWLAAAARMQGQLMTVLADLEVEVRQARQQLDEPKPQVASHRDMLADLRAIQQEFGPWRYDKGNQALVVETPSITLDGLYLGPFEIQLLVNQLAEARHGSVYLVVALDPHPAAGADHVTHPHVSDSRMCAGNANAAINTALVSGRLYDFFQLVHSVLTTYNPDSPYVAIEQWEGQQCADCGYRMCEDDRYFCEMCEQDYCDGCISLCRQCDLSTCIGCLRDCSHCDDGVCAECRTLCEGCDGIVCKNCVEEGLCPKCFEERNDDDSQEDSNEAAETPEPERSPQPATNPQAA